jgi:hypothetical protein
MLSCRSCFGCGHREAGEEGTYNAARWRRHGWHGRYGLLIGSFFTTEREGRAARSALSGGGDWWVLPIIDHWTKLMQQASG